MSNRKHGLTGIVYSADHTLHMIPDAESWWDDDYLERRSALCGGKFGTKTGFLKINGLRITDAWKAGDLCETCCERLQSKGATIPGFISDGEILHDADPDADV